MLLKSQKNQKKSKFLKKGEKKAVIMKIIIMTILLTIRNCFSLALDGKITLEFNIEKPHTTGLRDWIGFYEYGMRKNYHYIIFYYYFNFFR